MEIKITGSAKEIAELVLELQTRQSEKDCDHEAVMPEVAVEDLTVKDYLVVGS